MIIWEKLRWWSCLQHHPVQNATLRMPRRYMATNPGHKRVLKDPVVGHVEAFLLLVR